MKDYDKDEVIKKLHELKISPKRSLGQNFLVGKGAIEKIINSVKTFHPTSLVEVGPGLGALTEPLQAMKIPLLLLELDRAFSEMWRNKGLNIKEGDALKLDWQSLGLNNATLVSNLPYQISSSLVVERSINPCGISNMVLMFQKEVAQRIMAGPRTKEYGLLTVLAQACWKIENVLEAGPNEFYPAPNVASRVLSFERRPESLRDLSNFLTFVKAGFAQRRKLLLSNLKPIYSLTQTNKDQWEIKLLSLGYTRGARAEEVSVADWLKLYAIFFSGKNHGN